MLLLILLEVEGSLVYRDSVIESASAFINASVGVYREVWIFARNCVCNIWLRREMASVSGILERRLNGICGLQRRCWIKVAFPIAKSIVSVLYGFMTADFVSFVGVC